MINGNDEIQTRDFFHFRATDSHQTVTCEQNCFIDLVACFEKMNNVTEITAGTNSNSRGPGARGPFLRFTCFLPVGPLI